MPIIVWILFVLFVVIMLALDLGVFNRRPHEIKTKEALVWSVFWIALAMLFNVGLYIWDGKDPALLFFTGYVIEKSLSVDNLFVFLMLFTYFGVPKENQHKVLFWGVFGAIVMRAIFIFTGIALIERFHFTIYVFGIFLVFTGIKMAVEKKSKIEPEKNIVLKMFKRFFHVTKGYRKGNFFVRENGGLVATPLFVALLMVESFDIVFAVDSVPAILAVTRDPFIVFTSNVFAILGLRALYFVLAQFVEKFHYLKLAISVILSYVGVKMIVSDIYKMSPGVSSCIILAILLIAVVASIIKDKNRSL